ncbi:nucleotide exchange factor GrpE [Psychrobacillus lasiicapitis]|uniref:Protein GrpE n=1 Tax=Psychrobacillus lasiicapitis TaxID=1636719 RepID=A0A544TA21_9BACI|nr:nucleotide exchange factor GrpE [Psychrobacillus lasiicapitis]TQR14290.1 nucleotide exchange factor GrpE [Psychrobacillus lasiicapitis]GGA32566.1 protein GrpE [Psychrobacillus lasiicapitis]
MSEQKDEIVEELEAEKLDEQADVPAEDEIAETEEDVVEEVDELTLVKQQLEEEQNKAIRLRADFENYKRRVQLDKEADYKYRAQSVLSDILPVLDNFERALAVETTSEEAASLAKGVEMVYRSLLDAVKKEGLDQIEAEGVPFDPNFHQAVMQEKDDTKDSGVVLQELQKGYKLKDRILRPAMVKVNE